MRSGYFRRSDAVVFEVTGGLAVLLTERGDELITLNPLGTIVWLALEQPSAPDDLVELVGRTFERVPRDVIEHDIDTFIDELAASRLIIDDAHG